MKNIGFRAHDFGTFPTVDALAEAIRAVRTPTCIQLAIGKVLKPSRPWKEWDEEYVSSICTRLRDNGISVAVVGCYINPVHPDPDCRREHLARFRRSLELSRAFSCPIVGTETGSWTNDISYNIETYTDKVFSVLLRSVEEMVRAAEENDAVCALEAVSYHHTVCSVERMAKVLETFPSDHLKVIYDPVNLVPVNGIMELDGSWPARPSAEAQRRFYIQPLDAYQDRICAIHCKDYVLDDKGFKIGNKSALTGVFDWENFFKELGKRSIDVPILLENHDPATDRQTLSVLEKF